jgi:hypothetical protein
MIFNLQKEGKKVKLLLRAFAYPTKNSKQICPEIKLRGLVPNFYIHVSLSNLYIPMIGPQTQYSKIGGPIMGIYKLFT